MGNNLQVFNTWPDALEQYNTEGKWAKMIYHDNKIIEVWPDTPVWKKYFTTIARRYVDNPRDFYHLSDKSAKVLTYKLE